MAKEKSEDTQKEETQAEETQEDTQVEEQVELSDEQVVEQVSQLTDSEESNKESGEELEVQAEEQTEETEEQTEVQAEIPMIDEEMIKEFPVLRSYIGKPVTDLAPTYSRIVSQFTQNSQELSELKRQMAESSLQKTDDIPDMVEKPEEFKKWLADRDKTNQDIGAGQTQEPQIDFMGELAKRLPQGTDVQGTVNKWMNKNARRLFDGTGEWRPEMESYYSKDPEALYQEVSEFLANDEKANLDEADVRKAGHKKLQKDFKNARKSKKEMPGAQVQTISKDVKLTTEEEMLIEIQELVQEG